MSTCAECGAPHTASCACPGCGAPAAAADGHGHPPHGRVLFATDFRGHGDPRGLHIRSAARHERRAGPPAELFVELPADDGMIGIVSTVEPHAEAEIAVSARFVEEPHGGTHASFGVSVRSSDAGDYVVRVSWTGRYSVGLHVHDTWRDYLVPWTNHPAITAGIGARNRLRVAAIGDSVRVVINGTLVTTVRDARFATGKLRVMGAPHGHGLRVALSAVEVRT